MVSEIKRATNAAWYQRNKIKKAEQGKIWRAANKDRRRHQFRAWHMRERGGFAYYFTRPEPDTCEACGNVCGIGGAGGIQWDHDHETGKFRGWLCPLCNRALGMLQDDLNRITKLWRYLLRHEHDELRESNRDNETMSESSGNSGAYG